MKDDQLNGKPLLAMLLLPEPVMPETERLQELLIEYCGPDLPVQFEERDERVPVQFFQLDGVRFCLSLMPAPVPWSDLELLCTVNPFGQRVAEFCRGHQAHLLVAQWSGSADLIADHLRQTKVVAAVTAAVGASAVYYNGMTVTLGEEFLDQARSAAATELPTPLWIGALGERKSEQLFHLYTLGLDSFGLMEIEVEAHREQPGPLVGWLYDLATYLLSAGPVIADGDTIGQDANERIVVRHRPSLFDPERQVYGITLGRPPKPSFLNRVRSLFS